MAAKNVMDEIRALDARVEKEKKALSAARRRCVERRRKIRALESRSRELRDAEKNRRLVDEMTFSGVNDSAEFKALLDAAKRAGYTPPKPAARAG